MNVIMQPEFEHTYFEAAVIHKDSPLCLFIEEIIKSWYLWFKRKSTFYKNLSGVNIFCRQFSVCMRSVQRGTKTEMNTEWNVFFKIVAIGIQQSNTKKFFFGWSTFFWYNLSCSVIFILMSLMSTILTGINFQFRKQVIWS